jgi:hypothetical protein
MQGVGMGLGGPFIGGDHDGRDASAQRVGGATPPDPAIIRKYLNYISAMNDIA